MTAYATRHWRVRERRGPANLQKCTHCAERGIDKQAFDWACLHDRDGEDPQDYIPLCRQCHIAYDGSGHRTPHTEETKALLSQKNRGYEHTPGAREKIRATSTGRKHTPESRAKMSAQRKAAAAARGPMPGEQRAKLSAALKGNANAAGSPPSRRQGAAAHRSGAGEHQARPAAAAGTRAGRAGSGGRGSLTARARRAGACLPAFVMSASGRDATVGVICMCICGRCSRSQAPSCAAAVGRG